MLSFGKSIDWEIVQDVDQWAESQLHHCMQGSRQVCHQLVQEEVGAEMEVLQSWMMQKWHQTKRRRRTQLILPLSTGTSSNSCSTGGTTSK